MSTSLDRIREALAQNDEKLRLLAYFVLILVLSFPLSRMLLTAWQEAQIIQALFRLRLWVGLDLAAVSVFLFGIYLGFLLLMSIDPKKRWQAFLLWIATGIAMVVLASQNFLVDNLGPANVLPLVVGIAIAAVLGGGRTLLELRRTRMLEFRRAARGFYLVLTIIVVIALIESHVVYPDFVTVRETGIELNTVERLFLRLDRANLFLNLGVSGLFIVTVRQFIKYDAENNFFVLGPRRSGKSLFLIGAYIEALEQEESRSHNAPLQPSQDLMEMVDGLNRQRSQWVVDATETGQIKRLYFRYTQGAVFPMNVEISTIDYAGEYLGRLPDGLLGTMDGDMDDVLESLVTGVEMADTLVFVLDVERFVNDESLEISEYFSIIQQAEKKEILLVATKADLLAEEFREERGLEAHRYFDDFCQYVDDRLRDNQQVRSLVNEGTVTSIYPVYYQTTVNENGDRVPMRDANGNVMTVGFDKFLSEVGG